MILVLLSGFAMSESFAQANCKPSNCSPCPPGCCIVNCCTSKGAAASVTNQPVDVAFASLLIEDVQSTKQNCNMSRKEMKACIASCKTVTSAAALESCKPAPSCHSTAAVIPAVQTASVHPKQ